MKSDITASEIDFICYTMRQADWDRAKRRTLINSLFNGTPPYTQKEQDDSKIKINVNDLSGPRAAHDARAQFTSAFMKPGAYFNCRTDAGRKDKREAYGRTVTNEISKVMKRCIAYTETQRSKWAMTVLHGIAPCIFQDQDCWRPRAIGIEDVLVPSNTELMDIAEGGLTFIPIYRTFNATQLIKLTRGPVIDPAWNKPLVDECLAWVQSETLRVAGTNWQNVWAPEKWEEQLKGDGVVFSTDTVPTINVWDFYFFSDSDGDQGWKRKMILDSWTMPDGPTGMRTRRNEGPFKESDQFLYDSKKRNWCNNRQEIISFQFADLSAVAPFRYHTVRSLGYLLYSVCHLQNRLRCKFNEAVFEQLMVLMRIKTQDDMQRALSVNLMNYGFVDDSVEFIKAGDRYQVNAQLAQMGLYENQNLITRGASSYTNRQPGTADNQVPTATQWMGEEQRVTQLVSAGLMQAYEYQKPEYREIFRRLLKKDSGDKDAKEVQLKCLKAGVPEKVLYNMASWEIEPERVLGAGNKSVEMMIAQQLMSYRHLHDPDAQRLILKKVDLAITDDAALTDILVPEQPQISNSIHDAQMSVGTLLLGQPMEFRQNVNHGEYASALLNALEMEITKINATGGVTDQSHLMGLQNLAGVSIQGEPIPGNGAQAHIMAFAQDPEAKSESKMLNDRVGKAMNEVKAFAQRLQEQQQQQNGNGQPDPEVLAKIQSQQMMAEAKAANTRESHAARTAQRQVAFEMEQERKNQETQAEIARENVRFSQEVRQEAIRMVQELEKAKLETPKEPNQST